MKTDFATFKSGDLVSVKPDHPYLNTSELTPGVVYEVDKMLTSAGVITIKRKQWNKTFPDDLFVKVELNSKPFDSGSTI